MQPSGGSTQSTYIDFPPGSIPSGCTEKEFNMLRKNQARLIYKGSQFVIWQDANLNWCYNFEELENVPTSSKELQAALNMIHETIDERSYRRRGNK
jgi:hypothetical protein